MSRLLCVIMTFFDLSVSSLSGNTRYLLGIPLSNSPFFLFDSLCWLCSPCMGLFTPGRGFFPPAEGSGDVAFVGDGVGDCESIALVYLSFSFIFYLCLSFILYFIIEKKEKKNYV